MVSNCAVELLKRYTTCYDVREINGSRIDLKRCHPGECLIHKRVHDSEGGFLTIAGTRREVIFHCYREPKKRLCLGTLNPELEPNEDKAMDNNPLSGSYKTDKELIVKQDEIMKKLDEIANKKCKEEKLCKLRREYEVIKNLTFEIQDQSYIISANRDAENRSRGKYAPALPILNKATILLNSVTGTGKTWSICEYINEMIKLNPLVRILVISPRITYSRAIYGVLREMTSIGDKWKVYLDDSEEDLCDNDYLICQVDSLGRLGSVLKDSKYSYDIIINDECESNFAQFSSPTLENKLCLISRVFEQLMLSANNVINSDGYLSGRSITAMRQLRDNIIIMNNPWRPEGRKMYCYDYQSDYLKEFKTQLNLNKKIFYVSGSKKHLEDIENTYLKGSHYRYLIYNSLSSDEQKKLLSKVNDIWNQYDIILISPTITIGIDFNIPYFDVKFVYATPNSCPARDIFQSLMRVRQTLTEETHVFLGKHYNGKQRKPSILSEIKKDIKILAREELSVLNQYYSDGKINECPSWLLNVIIMNKLETGLSRHNFIREFLKLARYDNYEIIIIDKKSFTMDEIEELKSLTSDIDLPNFDAIPNISYNEYQDIHNSIKYSKASTNEKIRYSKYEFMKLFDYQHRQSETVKELWTKISTDKQLLHNLNFTNKFKNFNKEIIKQDNINRIAGIKPSTGLKLHTFKDLLFNIGLDLNKSCLIDNANPNIIEYINNKKHNLIADLELTIRKSDKNLEKYVGDFISRVLECTIGKTITTCRKHVRTNGKSLYYYEYSYNPPVYWDLITSDKAQGGNEFNIPEKTIKCFDSEPIKQMGFIEFNGLKLNIQSKEVKPKELKLIVHNNNPNKSSSKIDIQDIQEKISQFPDLPSPKYDDTRSEDIHTFKIENEPVKAIKINYLKFFK
jgi:hypothetical protein